MGTMAGTYTGSSHSCMLLLHRASHCRAPTQAVLGLPCSVGSSLSTSPKAPKDSGEVLLPSLIPDVLADLVLGGRSHRHHSNKNEL